MVLHFRHEETEVQQELPNVMCVVRQQSLSSPAIYTIAPQHNWAESGKPLIVSERGNLEPSLFIQFPRLLPFLQNPQASERDPLYRSFHNTCFAGDFLACVSVSHPKGVCSNMRVYPELEQLLERESLTAPGQSPALFPLESGPTATA